MNLHTFTIPVIKKALQEKKFSAVELTQAYLDRIEKHEPKLHAFVTVTKEKSLLDAKKADEMIKHGKDLPLLGIPYGVKDNFNAEGTKTTASAKVLEDFISPYNSTVVDRLQNAGAILVGKTNLDAWAHGSSTETSDFGPSKNPWDISRLPGGSSGGSAVAVSADECAFSIGSETAGSTRLPAAWCGVVGFKPTYGRVSRYGMIAMGSSLDSPGPMTKTVEDTALVLQILAGKDEFDATTSSLGVPDYTTSLKAKKKMTIGIAEDYFDGVDTEIAKTVKDALKELEKKGHKIKSISLFDPKYAIDVYTIIQRSEVSSNLARMDGIRFGHDRSFFGEEAKRRIMLGTYVLSGGHVDAYYKKAQKVRTVIIDDFAKAFESVDVIVGPTTPVTALPIGSTKNNPMFGEIIDRLMEPSSIAGLCGISIPVGFSKEKLPIGMQIIGPQFGEENILNLAYQYEKEHTVWQQQAPLQ